MLRSVSLLTIEVNPLTEEICKLADMQRLTLAQRAQTARTRAGFRREIDAARKIGCSRPLVIRWESGDAQSIGQKYLLSAARAYRVRPEWLAMESDDDGYPWTGESSSRITELDPALVSKLARLLQEIFDEEIGRPYNIADEPELFVGAYKLAAGGTAHDMRRAMLWLGGKIKELTSSGTQRVQGGDVVDEGTRSRRHGAASAKT